MSTHDALLLIGHGSARYPDAAGAMRGHADSLRRQKRFADVAVGVLNGTPSVTQALAEITGPDIRVVPFFMEDGYFTRVAVPRALAAPTLANRHVKMCQPVGVHDGMAGLIERQALAACAALGVASRQTAVLIVGHGSSSAPGRTLALHRHTGRIAATELFARIESACLEEPPRVAGVLAGLRAHPVVVIGFFANQGSHVRDDLPKMIAAEQAARTESGRRVWFQGSIADDPEMTEIILCQANSGPV